jgi:hypothetical protein
MRSRSIHDPLHRLYSSRTPRQVSLEPPLDPPAAPPQAAPMQFPHVQQPDAGDDDDEEALQLVQSAVERLVVEVVTELGEEWLRRETLVPK